MAGPCGVIRLDGGMPGLCRESKKGFLLLNVVNNKTAVGREDQILH